ncbi:MAG: NAD/NADP octopine/nopaline dehydrogenase family protein [Muribaculaceae bacterium]|nr:NAD/NADP octopine/nopaline dehydrogenase family protein [Muribaculaceae bacterium]
MNFAVIGAGNGGQAMAAHLSMMGHSVALFDRNPDKLKNLSEITLSGRINSTVKIHKVTDSIPRAIENADVIMVTTVATAHADVARQMAPFLKENQIVILNPGRTGGVWEFRNVLDKLNFSKKIYLAEAQTLLYACRIIQDGSVNIIGIKDSVLLAAESQADTDHVLSIITPVFPAFKKAQSLFQTGLENIGCIFHPCVVLCNAAAIERGERFYFYRDMTPQIADFIQKVDKERIDVGNAYGIKLQSATDWISSAYDGVKGETLCERMRNNPAYYDIIAPASIYTRQMFEDIPTGLVPISQLGKLKGVNTPLMDSIIDISGALLNQDFRKTGRKISNCNIPS